ncbi:MAG: AsnC family transcriptional regulator [Candidatus Lokiarchaeota archaeon]|nr:AsnC family transcriptional regulator [Candidatus Lokiarchaeota archaeon]
MDLIDLQIIRKLFINSRIPYRELANQIGLTVGAVHKRVQLLIETGLIKTFIARPSLSFLNAVFINIAGASKLQSFENIVEELEKNPYTILLGLSTVNYVYITAILRNISEMHEVTSTLTQLCKIDDPLIVIYDYPRQKIEGTLSRIDYLILKSLNRNSRKSVTDVADEIGLSSKTVSKHINNMLMNNLASFSIEFEPSQENDIVTIYSANIPKNADMKVMINKITQKLSQNLLYIRTYSNAPLFLSIHILVQTLGKIKYFEDILRDFGLEDIIPRVIHKAYYFKCWLDDF